MTAPNAKPRAGEHTKGPWRAELSRTSGYVMSGNFCIASLGDCCSPRDINARRIVACVNACEGMDDPATEISEMRECVRLLGEEQYAAAERDVLAELNRELVEALELIAGGADGPRTAREALGKVRPA